MNRPLEETLQDEESDEEPSLSDLRRRWRIPRSWKRRARSLEVLCPQVQAHLIASSNTLLERIGEGTGWTIPASAVGWIAWNLLYRDDLALVDQLVLDDRWTALQRQLLRVTHLRITNDPWPRLGNDKYEPVPVEDTQRFLRDYDRLLHQPLLDLALFPHCRVLWLDQVLPWRLPPNLQVLRLEHTSLGRLALPTPLPSLTHVRLSHCGLWDTARGYQSLPNVESLSLSHNELFRSRQALKGLKHLTRLQKLDLSYNHLVALPGARYALGNLQTLNLSHNQLKSVEGIDRLYSLEHLQLHANQLEDCRGLVRLIQLETLTLRDNPLALRRKHRVDVFLMFYERRISDVDLSEEQVQALLPTLDGWPVSGKEIAAVRELVPPIVQITETPVLHRRRRTRRRVTLDESEGTETQPTATELPMPSVLFTARDVLESMMVVQSDEEEDPVEIEEDDEDVLESSQIESDVQEVERVALDEVAVAESHLEPAVAVVDSELKPADQTVSVNPPDILEDASNPDEERLLGEDEPCFVEDDETNGGNPDIVEDETMVLQQPINELEPPTASSIDVAGDATKLKDSGETTVTVTESEVPYELDQASQENNEALAYSTPVRPSDVSNASEMDSYVRHISDHSSSTPTSVPSPSPVHLGLRVVSVPEGVWQDDQSVPSSVASPYRSDAANPVYRLAEEQSSYDGPPLLKEVNILENLETYFQLFVFSHTLDAKLKTNNSVPSGSLDGEEWRQILAMYPKIQLWPVDWRAVGGTELDQLETAAKVNPKEEFRRVWRERVVACGKPGLRRVSPNRTTRFGFHGELLWSAAQSSHLKPDIVSEARNTILCLSTTAFYVILDHDPVSDRAKEQKRKFPLPISPESKFSDGVWPHALARHPIESLQAITIGFGFQRLILRFRNALQPDGVAITYILLTSSKTETVSLLKELQDLTAEARRLFAPADMPLRIDNDDPHVLDALATAVAPDSIGVVLHYQVLQQRWRHGDRGDVRRVCVVTDTKLYLLDEDYLGDGSDTLEATGSSQLGDASYRVVDSASVGQVGQIHAADADPNAVTLVIRPLSRLQRTHNWRLVCRSRDGAERLMEDVRKAITLG